MRDKEEGGAKKKKGVSEVVGTVNRQRDSMEQLEKEMRKKQAAARRAAQAKEPQVYVVKPGDNLSKIAKAVYGDASRWQEIFEANKDTLKDPNLIRVGQELRIPEA